MSRQAREGDALLFVELNGKLSNQRIIQRPAALLTFLQTHMADSGSGLRAYSLPNEVRIHSLLVVFLNCSPVWLLYYNSVTWYACHWVMNWERPYLLWLWPISIGSLPNRSRCWQPPRATSFSCPVTQWHWWAPVGLAAWPVESCPHCTLTADTPSQSEGRRMVPV